MVFHFLHEDVSRLRKAFKFLFTFKIALTRSILKRPLRPWGCGFRCLDDKRNGPWRWAVALVALILLFLKRDSDFL